MVTSQMPPTHETVTKEFAKTVPDVLGLLIGIATVVAVHVPEMNWQM